MQASWASVRKAKVLTSSVPLIVIGIGVGITTGVTASMVFRSQLLRLIPSVKMTGHVSPGAQPPNTKGPDSAPIVMEEFSDFQCPPCKSLYEENKRIEARYGGQLKLIYRHYPIEGLHKNAFGAACAAEAARQQGNFWEMHDRLFENQEAWASRSDAESLFIDYARSMKLDIARFRKDYAARETRQRVRDDQQRGDSIGVPGTPVVLINGVQVSPGAMTYAGLKTAIENGLKSTPECFNGCPASKPSP